MMLSLVCVVTGLAVGWLIGYIVGWNKAHKYWEHVDTLEDDDGDRL